MPQGVPDPTFPGDPIYVVEPHSDDAFLSLGWSIRVWCGEGRKVVVATIYSADEVRAQEAKEWCGRVGAHWLGLGFEQSGATGLSKDDPPTAPLPDNVLPDDAFRPGAARIWPLGLPHPEHLAVAAIAPAGDLRYVDTPYQVDLYNQRHVRDALLGRTIAWWMRPPLKKWEHAPVFASQSPLFENWTTARLELVPEIVVR